MNERIKYKTGEHEISFLVGEEYVDIHASTNEPYEESQYIIIDLPKLEAIQLARAILKKYKGE